VAAGALAYDIFGVGRRTGSAARDV
jgi:hypothetical protein